MESRFDPEQELHLSFDGELDFENVKHRFRVIGVDGGNEVRFPGLFSAIKTWWSFRHVSLRQIRKQWFSHLRISPVPVKVYVASVPLHRWD